MLAVALMAVPATLPAVRAVVRERDGTITGPPPGRLATVPHPAKPPVAEPAEGAPAPGP